ncbi:hypothetical protein [Streptomyces sp. A 4/2]|uniref:hypothetical protein n=1 Tax=Streptomyces sp. A 4/2 TaxID=2934314 RepID=UPI0020256B9F|nr:hypothetical protein [Streptomyces sp. A 4/2]
MFNIRGQGPRSSCTSPPLAKTAIPNGHFSSHDDLISKIESYTLAKNEPAKPYRWTYDGTPLKAA